MIQGQLELGSASHTITTSDGGASSDLVISAGITGTSNLIKNGTGAVEYSGGDSGRITNTGTTLVNEGRLILNKTSGPQILGDLTIGNNIGGQGAATVRYGVANNTPDTILDSVNVTADINRPPGFEWKIGHPGRRLGRAHGDAGSRSKFRH